MMRVHQHVEARPLGRRGQTVIDIGQRKVLRSVLENRVGLRILSDYAPRITQPHVGRPEDKYSPAHFFARRSADIKNCAGANLVPSQTRCLCVRRAHVRVQQTDTCYQEKSGKKT